MTGWLAATPNPLGAALKGSPGRATAFYDSSGEVIYYVVPLDPQGFVVTTPDSDLEPIIAFSAAGSFEPGPQNPLYVLLQRDLPERLEQMRGAAGAHALAMSPAQAKWARLAKDGTPVPMDSGLSSVDDLRVAPFVQSRWDQSSIWNGSGWVACYNYYTPPYASGASSNYVCGCNNTAWAQIMRYYNYPTQSIGTATFSISVDGVSTNRQLRGGERGGRTLCLESDGLCARHGDDRTATPGHWRADGGHRGGGGNQLCGRRLGRLAGQRNVAKRVLLCQCDLWARHGRSIC